MTAREYLRSRSWLGSKFGLETMRLLVREFGHPERSFKSVLIAGTNGKGSVSAYLDEALRAVSLKVGRYTSPHLIDVRERITVSGHNIGNAEFERLVLEVRDRSEAMLRGGLIENHPNHFEILTLVAFLHFQRQAVDMAVLEVGLGGRLDATNVASPMVSAIVSIDFDHEEFLGQTLASIASEKAGVLRKKRDVILGPVPPEAERAIRRVAHDVGARVVPAFRNVSVRPSGTGLTIKTPLSRYAELRPLPGAHQRCNLVVAIRTLEAIAASCAPLDLGRAVAAMSTAVWPGRLERISGRPPVLLDGAHNPAGARALGTYLAETKTPCVLIFGAMRDKHVREMATELFHRARLVIATRVRMLRAATTTQLAEIGAALGVSVIEEPSIRLALQKAKRSARPGETVVVAGSLYLVGAARKRLLEPKAPRKPPQTSRALRVGRS
ncbi:MAG: bifunctional folylpolyglutamate synthase/dihydrofolate synthase [Vicinamibacteria bacterium]|nr:bifunctional folylpolyglutamate synthase/dihydrofolate synthase [Vicinamibacteria bacterium]